ncbi:hypothetical protein HUJ04_010341 [Dendroctonus ponderosae]|nr:hypothetical protein HUJ04_010341 [Dendroctonus ponderosae]
MQILQLIKAEPESTANDDSPANTQILFSNEYEIRQLTGNEDDNFKDVDVSMSDLMGTAFEGSILGINMQQEDEILLQSDDVEVDPAKKRLINTPVKRIMIQDLNEPPSEDEAEVQEIELPDGKIGAKKRAKLEAKAEEKAVREVEEKSRLERQKKLELEELERAKQKVKEEAEQKAKEEEEKRAKEEKERKEQEEYLKMKEAFQVEEEGYEEGDQEDSQNLLQEFVNHIKGNKVVIIKDLAARFKLKTQACLDRIKDLQNDDILTGVIDDRGKFIYVSKSEMDAVAKFIRQRGRVSIAELAESSSQLINLIPVTQ